MKTIKIKIIKCCLPSYWYANQIECIFNVFDTPNEMYVLDMNMKTASDLYLIDKSDCIIMES